ncbi:unnamed protein product [Pleuronectes platessa]|uniref:Uncharacterized protein n=1 Tax=Pleuronectes platessa TaxID=8262 RepID=A0A9N7U1X5_PLEPL|nr:unnamed protein product [Pleuronectes platessa]
MRFIEPRPRIEAGEHNMHTDSEELPDSGGMVGVGVCGREDDSHWFLKRTGPVTSSRGRIEQLHEQQRIEQQRIEQLHVHLLLRCVRILFQDGERSAVRTLQWRAGESSQVLAQLCADSFGVSDPQQFTLYWRSGGEMRPLPPQAQPQDLAGHSEGGPSLSYLRTDHDFSKMRRLTRGGAVDLSESCVVSRRGSGLVKTLLRTRTSLGGLSPERRRPPDVDSFIWISVEKNPSPPSSSTGSGTDKRPLALRRVSSVLLYRVGDRQASSRSETRLQRPTDSN